MRAVLYARLSRATTTSTSIRGQNDELYARAEAEGWDVVATFTDNGKSGGKQRENAVEALRMLRDSEADVLAVYAYDRWSRMGIADSAQVINAIYDRAKTPTPARFVAIREGIDSDREGWELLTAFTADVAQKERDRIVARRKAAIGRLRAEGRLYGNGPAPFGYRSAAFPDGRPGRRLVPDPVEAAIVRDVADQLIAGVTANAIAAQLRERHVPTGRSPYRLAVLRGAAPVDEDGNELGRGTWTPSRVSQTWQSQHLVGRMTVGTHHGRAGTPILDPATGLPATVFEPLLSADVWERLQARFSPGRAKQRKAPRLLSGYAYCAACDRKLYVVRVRTNDYYRCMSRYNNGTDCPGVQVSATLLEDAIVDEYRRTFGRMRAYDDVVHSENPEKATEAAAIAEQLRSLSTQLAAEVDPEREAALFADLSALKRRRAALDREQSTTWTERVYTGHSMADRFDATADVARRRDLLGQVLDHVAVHRGAGRSTWRSFWITDEPEDAG